MPSRIHLFSSNLRIPLSTLSTRRNLQGSETHQVSSDRVSSSSSSSSSISSRDDLNPSLLVITLILVGVFFASAILHILLRYISRLCKSAHIDQDEEDVAAESIEPIHHFNHISTRRVVPQDNNHNQKLIESLPLFSFESVTGLRSSASADCAVCLSKFERHDQLRLLPICCHAFHSDCIDTWLSSNSTCPLCRSTVHVAKSEDYLKLFSSSSSSSSGNGGNDSFRIEIGSVSRRRIPSDSGDDSRSRSYSMGSFEYVVEDESEVIVVEPTHRRGVSECTFGAKDDVSAPSTEATANPPPGSEVAGEVAAGAGRGWLRDYVDKIASSSSSSFSSRARSFRFSGRFFTGSSRQSDGLSRSDRRSVDVAAGDSNGGSWDLEGNRYGEEISSFFRWLSGI